MSTSSGTSEASWTEQLSFALLHLTGPRRGEEDRYATERVSVGRGRNNDCSFDPEKERSVSHRHCEIRVEDQVPILYDIGSLNGTYLNGRRVRRAPLADGDEIGLGREGPRLRFHIQGGTPGRPIGRVGVIEAPEMAATPKNAYKPGPTAEELRPTGVFTGLHTRSVRRYRLGLVGLVLAIVAICAAAFFMITRLQERIEGLEQTQHGPRLEPERRLPPPPSVGSTKSLENEAPIAPLGAMGTSVLVQAQVHDARGRLVIQRELGGGVLVRHDRVATTYTVLELGRAFLHSGDPGEGSRSLVISQGGVTSATVRIVGSISMTRSPPTKPSEDLALVCLAETPGTTLPRALLGSPQKKPIRILTPGLPSIEISISGFVDADGAPTKPEDAALFRIFNLPNTPDLPLPTMSGFPVHSGDALVGLYLGDRNPNLVVTGRLIDALIQFGESHSPDPLD